MPLSIQALREDRKKLAAEVRDLVENHPEDQAWTSANDEQYSNLVKQVEDLDAKIDRQQKVLDLNAHKQEQINKDADRQNISTDEAEHLRNQTRQVAAAYMRGGMEALSDEQREHIRAMQAKNPQNALSTGTPSEGGYTTSEEVATELAIAMKAYGGMREAGRVIRTSHGNRINFPTSDPTSEEGEIVGENVEVDDEEPAFGTVPLDVYKFSSKGVAVPWELLQDTSVDIVGYINELLAMRIGRITERMFAVGTGTNQPRGIVTAATVGVVAASATAVTHDELLDLEHSVDPIYRASPGARWMFNDTILLQMKKLKDTQNRPLFLPGLEGAAYNTIAGYRYGVNQNFANAAADAKPVAFGDFSKYVIRDVMQLMLFRMTDSFYTRKGQVGFLAFMRTGGNYVDAGGAVKTMQMASE